MGRTGVARKLAQLIALPVVAVTLALVVPELYLRHVGFLETHLPYPCAVSDPVLPHVLRPNCTETARAAALNTAADVVYQTNSLGLRGDEPRAGTHRILVLGDSYTEGFGLANADTFPAQLERALHAAGWQDAEVVNGGVTAFSTAVYPLLFHTRLASLHARDVLLDLDFSDLLDDVNFLGLAEYDAAGEPASFPGRAAPLPAWFYRLVETNRSALLRFVSQELNQWYLSRLRHERRPAMERIVAQAPQLVSKAWLQAESLDVACWENYEITAKMIMRLRAEVESTGASLAIHMYPPGQLVKQYPRAPHQFSLWQRWERSGNKDPRFRCWMDLAGVDVIRRFAAVQGIPFFDSRDVVFQHPEKEKLYFDRDAHWTALGVRVVVESLAPQLVRALRDGAVPADSGMSADGPPPRLRSDAPATQ